ncbi:MAG: lysophospholipid acyltransferase family protein [Planctomycetota bacterium]
MSRRTRWSLHLQRALSHLFFPVIGSVAVLILRCWGCRVQNLRQIRQQFAEIIRQERGPLLICGNHLTKIDSAMIAWVLASNWTYFTRFRVFPWNIPEWANYKHSRLQRVVCYLTKCIPMRRESAEQTKELLEKLEYQLSRGDAVSIFPEGRRSRTGRLDMEDFGYGVGQIAQKVEGTKIVCVYLRCSQQEAVSSMPPRHDDVYVDLRVVTTETERGGLRGAREISTRTMNALHEMEQKYFADEPSGETRPEPTGDSNEPGTDNAIPAGVTLPQVETSSST